MTVKFNLIDAEGRNQIVPFNMDNVREAGVAGAAHPLAHLSQKMGLLQNGTTAAQQIYAQMGLGDKKRTHNMQTLATGMYLPDSMRSASVNDNTIVGRTVTQAYLFDAIEATLRDTRSDTVNLFNSRAAAVDSINDTRFERTILDFRRPEAGKPRAIAQLSEPTRFALMTASDRPMTIVGDSIGIEYSDQVGKNLTLNIVELSIQRQAEEAATQRVEFFLNSFLNGDTDIGMGPLSALPNTVFAASALDAAATTGLTQTAWMKWLHRRTIKIDTIITDLDGALEIERRQGRPVVIGDNATSPRIDTLESVLNPNWPDEVKVFLSTDPNWPAGTIVGFDSRYAYHHVISTSLDYSAFEQDLIRRSTRMRVDQGSIAYRMYDEAWSVLTFS